MMSDAARNTVTRSAVAAASVNSAGEETAATGGASTHDAGDRPPFGPPAAPDEIGRLGKYRIQRELGRGGMGAVYLAFDERLQRKVALKVMLPKAAANATAKDRFLREARAAAQISSDHVVNIYEADEIDGVPFIALQYLQGYPLDEYLKKKGLPTLPQVIRLGRETALGMAAAHKLGLVHRDIKPGNVWLEAPSGRVKILDFGLAKPVVGKEHAELTASGAIVGTPAYMAPEQGLGKPLDGRADLFSLGCMLYRLTAGRLPFEGPTLMAILTAIATEDPPPVRTLNPQVPEPLADLIRRLLAKNPADRPATATEVVKALDAMSAAAKKPAVVDPDAPTVSAAAAVYTPMAVSALPSNPFEHLADEESSAVEEPPKAAGKGGKRPPWPLIAAAVVALFGVVAVAGFIIIKITNKDGSTTEIKVPEGSKIEVDGKVVKPEPKKPDVKPPTPPTPRDPATAPPVKASAPAAAGLPAGKSGLRFGPGDTAVAAKVPLRPTTVVTIEAWVTVEGDDNPNAQAIAAVPNGYIAAVQDAFSFYTFHGGPLVPKSVPFGRRVHLAGVNDGTERRLYLDGKLIGKTDDAGGPIPENEQQGRGDVLSTITLGAEKFRGTIDAVRVSTVGRYDKEFTPPDTFTKDKDTFALYLFDEGQGDTLKDSSGNGYHAKITGAKWVKGAAADRDREVAEWVLSVKGKCIVRKDGKHIECTASDQLPAGGLELYDVNIAYEHATDGNAARFAGLKHLTLLNLVGGTVTDQGVAKLRDLPRLTYLNLHGTRVTDACLSGLKELPELTALILIDTAVTDAGLAKLKELPKLQGLVLHHTGVTDEGLQHLRAVPGLIEVSVLKTKVTEAGVKKLAAALPGCKVEWDGGTIEPKGK